MGTHPIFESDFDCLTDSMEPTIMGRSKDWFCTATKEDFLQTVKNIRMKSPKHVRTIGKLLSNNTSRREILWTLSKSARWAADREWFKQIVPSSEKNRAKLKMSNYKA